MSSKILIVESSGPSANIFQAGETTGGLVAKNPPAKQEMGVQSMGWEDPLEVEMATHSSILASEFPWTEDPGRLQYTGSQKLDMTQD